MDTKLTLDIKDICCFLLGRKPDIDDEGIEGILDWKGEVNIFKHIFYERFPNKIPEINKIFNEILND